MDVQRKSLLISLTLAAGLAVPVWAVEADDDDGPASASAAAVSPDGLRFNFKDAPFERVLDLFSSDSGKPIIREAELPSGKMTFVSAEEYEFGEALEILNLSLRMHGVQLQERENFLHLIPLSDAARTPTPVFGAGELERAGSTEWVTVTLPLNNASAALVVEQVRPLLSEHGLAQAVEQQNMLIVVESAERARRIQNLVRMVDEVPPADVSFRVFELEHGQAGKVLEALRGLVPEYPKMLVRDKNERAEVIDDVSKPAMRLQIDERLNAIVAVGPTQRMPMVEDLVNMLDSPEGAVGVEGGSERQMMTFALEALTPEQAAGHLESLFRAVPEGRRPTVLALEDAQKVTVVGAPGLLMQASALLSELDPSGGEGGARRSPEREARTLRLGHLSAAEAQRLAEQLMSAAQRHALRMAPTGDGRGLLVVGRPRDVEQLGSLLEALDQPREGQREVRVLEIGGEAAGSAVDRAGELYAQTHPQTAPPAVQLDAEAGSLTLVGTREQLAAFEGLLRTVQEAQLGAQQTRSYELRVREPGELAAELPRLVRPLLESGDGRPYVAPSFEAVEALETLIVRAREEQFATIEPLIERLDRARAGDSEFRVLRVSGASPAEVAGRAQEIFDARTAEVEVAGELRVRVDEASGSLLVTASPQAMRLYADAVQQAQQLTPPARTTRLVELENVAPEEIVEALGELIDAADPIDPARAIEPPRIRVEPRTGSLMVTAEEAQHQMIAELVRRLDRIEAAELPPLRLLQLRAADAVRIAQMLSEQYARRPSADRSARPVEVRSDAATNTLIVSAHEDLFADIRSFVEQLNEERSEEGDRETILLPLKVARAEDVAAAMDKLYPEPPIPLDRRGQPMPWLAEEKEVSVSAVSQSNSLIIDAPRDRIPSLKELAEKLDQVELAPVAELRTFRIVGADVQAVERTLSNLARNGNLSAAPQPGQQQVQVLIEAEPQSGTLIVAGDETTFQRVEQMLEDLSAVPVERQLRIVPVAGASAEEVRERALAIYGAQIKGDRAAEAVEVAVNGETNSLEVVARAEDMERFLSILDQLQQQAGGAREVRMIELRMARVQDVAAFLRELSAESSSLRLSGGPQPVFEPIESTNTLLVAADPSHLPIIEQLVRNLDSRQQGEMPPIRILRLRSSDATSIAEVLQQTYDRRSPEQKASQPVSIEADPQTNTLIVSAPAELHEEINRTVSELNDAQAYDGEGREIRVYPLKVAQAEELARTIDAMFPEPPMPVDPRTRQPRPDLQQAREVVVRADRATNALIVDAPARRLAGFEQLVRSLDQHQLAEDVELRTYRVERAELDSVARALRQLAESGALGQTGQAQVTVEVEPASRTLIVSGPAAIFDRVQGVLGELDSPAQRPQGVMRLYTLRHARADRIEPLLDRMLRQRLEELRSEQGFAQADGQQLLEIVADSASNTLIVSAPEPLQQSAQTLIEALDVEAAAIGRAEMRVVPLSVADAQGVAESLEQAKGRMDWPSGGESLSIIAAGGANALLLTGARADLDRVEELVAQMDVAVDADGLGVRTVTLRHARAEAVAPIVERVLARQSALDLIPEWSRWNYLARQPQGQEGVPQPVRVEAETRLNALVISGPVATLELAEQVIAQLDAPPEDGGERRVVRVITPVNADAQELAQSIEALFAEEAGDAQPPTVRVNRSSNSLLVRASAEQAERIDGLVEQIDRATLSAQRDLRLIHVDRSRASAGEMARALRQLLEQTPGVKVEVIRAEDLLAEPEAPAEATPIGSSRIDVRSLEWLTGGGVHSRIEMIRALVFAAAIGSVQQDAAAGPDGPSDDSSGPPGEGEAPADASQEAPGKASGPVGGGPALTIAVDERTNSLIIVGASRLADRVQQLAAELERQMPRAPTAVRVVTLPEGADANQVAGLVRETIRQVGQAGPDNAGGFSGRVAIAPDPAGGQVVVWANDEDFRVVGRLIGTLAAGGEAVALTVRVYPLTNIRGEAAARAVADLVSADPRGRQARRLRGLDLTVQDGAGRAIRASIDPATVSVTADPSGSAMIVSAPAEALPLIDAFVGMIDQSPVADRMAIRRYGLSNARAQELSGTLQQLFDAQRQGSRDVPRPRFVADDRTNSLLVTASDEQHVEVQRLLGEADAELAEAGLETEVFTLQQAQPTTVERVLRQIVIGRDPAKEERIQITADNSSAVVVVRAPAEAIEHAREIIERVDRAEATGLPMRTIRLEQADAQTVAQSLQQFFQQRAQVSSRPGRPAVNRVAVVGDRRSGTLVVTASDEDYEQIASLVETFDAAAPSQELQIRILELQNARVSDIQDTIENLQWELRYNRMFGGAQRESSGGLVTQVNERTNSVVLMGSGEMLETVERIVQALDREPSERTAQVVRAIQVERADLRAVANVVQRALATPGWFSWRGPDPDGVQIEVDNQRRMLIVVGKKPRVEMALEYIEDLEQVATGEGHTIESYALAFAQADRAARSLSQFFGDRARAEGRPANEVAVIGSPDGNVLIVSGDAQSQEIVGKLIGEIDRPELGEDRGIEIYAIRNGEPAEIARAIGAMFPQRSSEERVIVSPQAASSSLIVSAPRRFDEQIRGLINELDRTPTAEDVTFRTIPLESARADDVADALASSLPANLKVRVTPVPRSNSLMLTGSDEAIAMVEQQIRQMDTQPARSLEVFRRIELSHVQAQDLSWTLREMLRSRTRDPRQPAPSVDYLTGENALAISATAEQMEQIERMIAELDVPSARDRKTEFVKLEFADAGQVRKALEVFYGRYAPEAQTPEARRVTIVTDEASNSLVISAAESEWEALRSLLSKLDTAEYDTRRQIEVIPLMHADAQSVARALNEGFTSSVRRQIEQQRFQEEQQRQRRGGRPDEVAPPVLISVDEQTPSVSAEAQTNSLIVFAGREDLQRIGAIVRQLDIPDILKLPEPRVIPLARGKASEVARAVREAFGSLLGSSSPRGVMIYGDDASQSIIVRAHDEQFEQILALTQQLTERAGASRLSPRIIRVSGVPAARLQQTIQRTFEPVAQEAGEQLRIEIDRTSNALVVASSERLFEQIRALVEELDAGLPGGAANYLNQSVLIIDIEHNSPERVREILEQMGLTRPAPADRPGLVGEPISIVPLPTRRALAVLASPADAEIVAQLVRTIDAEPASGDQHVELVPMRLADAQAVAQTLQALLRTDDQQSPAGPAAALAEHVRRLSLDQRQWENGELEIDLTLPIRILADQQTNSVLIGSTRPNVKALAEVARTLDTLPVGDAVVVRIFPLQNAAAGRVRTVIEDLFRQGEALRRLPGTRRQGLPTTTTGQALAGEIAATVDERTNALVVAGREEAVAFVEVLIEQLDSDETSSWVEPRLIRLEYADPVRLAQTLEAVLVRGVAQSPEALGMQQQIARLRIALKGGGDAARAEADLFTPMSRLVIVPEEDLRALIVVGSQGNAAVVAELVRMLDVEAAAADNNVRVFPLRHAAADRVARVVREVFREREQVGAARPEDRLIVSADARTNALVVSTSPRSMEILEGLIGTLDAEEADMSVGVHVLPVPGVDVRRLAPMIERLMRERQEASRRAGVPDSPSDAFSVVAEPATGTLIIAASEENLQVVRELIGSLGAGDIRGGGDAVSELVYVEKGQAVELAQAIAELYVQRENERRGERAVTVIPNDRLNVLIVTGTAQDVQNVRELVGQLSRAEVRTAQDIRRIELRSANALEVVNLLQQVLAGRTLSGRAGAGQATRLRFYRERLKTEVRDQLGAFTEAEIDGALRDQVRLTPDLRTNSVVIAAPPEIMGLIVEIIDDLDTTTAGNRKIEMFRLENADAFAMAEVLRDLFNLQQQGNRFVLIPTPVVAEPGEGEEEPPLGRSFGGTTLTPVPDSRQELSMTIDPRTNTLLVSGTPDLLDLVRSVVTELDLIKATEREQLVVHLRNAKAQEVEETLQSYFRDEANRIRQTLGPEQIGSLARLLEQEVTLVGDEKSNKIVVSASPRYIGTIRGIIEELDAAPPQVVIEVLLAEVTIDSANTWGLEFQVGPFGGEDYIVGSMPAGAALATALGVPNLSVSSTDFSLLIRALEEQGRLEVLSRPHVIVNNNEIGFIQVVENISVIDSVDRFESGAVSANVVREDVGIILEVIPTISADGFVRMEIGPEISALSQRSIPISADFEAPIITRRQVNTVITVLDGQTVVLGGLLQTSDEERFTKVPFLGDIPLAGRLFQTDRINKIKTELLVILTPTVIRGGDGEGVQRMRDISDRHIDAMTARERIRAMLEEAVEAEPSYDPDEPAELLRPLPPADAADTQIEADAPTPGRGEGDSRDAPMDVIPERGRQSGDAWWRRSESDDRR